MIENTASVSLGAALNQRLDYLVARQGLVSSNIANASTPNYTAQDITFTGALKTAQLEMATTNSNHMQVKSAGSTAGKVVDAPGLLKNNGNNVDVEQELIKLSEVQLEYQQMTQLMGKYASMQRLAMGRQQ